MWMPFLMLLVSGLITFGRITYLEYVLQKIVYTAARTLAVGQNLNFCDGADPAVAAALANAINDPATGEPLVIALTSDMLVVTTRCYDANGVLGDCDISIESVVQKATHSELAEIVWVTHEAPGRNIAAALERISALPVVSVVSNWLRVEE